MSSIFFPRQTTKSILRPCVLAVCLALLFSWTASAQDSDTTFETSLRVARAVGLKLAGQTMDGETGGVAVGRSIQPDPYLTQNDFQLALATIHNDAPDRVEGALIFEDAMGRLVHKACIASYAADQSGGQTVRAVTIRPYTPPVPTAEVYILDATRVSLKDLHAMANEDLLAFAREHTEVITAEARDISPRTYHVLVFARDRLQPDDAWVLFAESSQGFSWNNDGWGVAGLTDSFALNGPEETVFRIFYAPGKKSVFAGKVMAAGVFTNQYIPPIPLTPMSDAAVTPLLEELRNAYQSKSFPTM